MRLPARVPAGSEPARKVGAPVPKPAVNDAALAETRFRGPPEADGYGRGMLQSSVPGKLACGSAPVQSRVVEVRAWFLPKLDARNDIGLATYSPVSEPWASAKDERGAVEAVRDAKILPGLEVDVLAAALDFRRDLAADPKGAANAFIFAMASEQKVQTNRLREDVRTVLAPLIRRFAEAPTARADEAEQILSGKLSLPSRTGGQDRTREVSAELRAGFMRVLRSELASEAPFAVAVEKALSSLEVPLKLETDAIKLLSAHFSGERISLKDTPYEQADATKVGPAQYNTALHPMAAALMRLVVGMVLDRLRPGDDIVVMAGGVAAGKGFAAKKASLGFDTAKVLLDFDGESSQSMLSTLLELCRDRGVRMNVVGVVTDPIAAHIRSLTRTHEEGRTVSETAAAYSHTVGIDNLTRFAEAHGGADDVEVVFIENKGRPVRYDGLPPPPPSFEDTVRQFTEITDAVVERGAVPDWVRARYDGREGSNPFMLDKITELETNGLAGFVVDSLMEDRNVHRQALAR